MRDPNHSRATALVVAALLLASCGPSATAPSPLPKAPAAGAPAASPEPSYEGEVSRFKGDPRIGVYVSTPWGFSTSSYWIEGPDGLVVIDTQFIPSAAKELIDAAEATTGKKVKLAVVLHANPDKFNGTATLQARGIKVVTSAQVAALIPGVHEKRLKAFYERYQPDYPKEPPRPDTFGAATTELEAAGLKITAHALGPGCSEAHVVVEFDGHLFAGDLIANGTHSWLEIGRADAWLQRIEEMRARKPRFVHPGRGGSGGPELIDSEEAYLLKFMEIVAAEKPELPAPKEGIERVKERIKEAFPDLDFPVFLNLGVPAEWARQARARGAGGAAPARAP
jgi:glyoxylase-like metal-dependent hydrolase (beta-lactamase superfamily II)